MISVSLFNQYICRSIYIYICRSIYIYIYLYTSISNLFFFEKRTHTSYLVQKPHLMRHQHWSCSGALCELSPWPLQSPLGSRRGKDLPKTNMKRKVGRLNVWGNSIFLNFISEFLQQIALVKRQFVSLKLPDVWGVPLWWLLPLELFLNGFHVELLVLMISFGTPFGLLKMLIRPAISRGNSYSHAAVSVWQIE